MSAKPYFKIWAAETLLSDDMDELTDTERSIWLMLMCVTSLEEPRWQAATGARLAKKCKTTPQKLIAALAHMAELGMVSLEDGVVTMANAARWNEETERRKKPSDSPEAIRERVTRMRKGADVTPPVTRYTNDVTPPVTPSNAAYKEEEKEEEEEKEKNEEEEEESDRGVTRLPERDLAETVLASIPQKFRYDALTSDECYQFARDFPGMFTETAEAIAEARRAGELPFPKNLRRYMPGAQTRPTGHIPPGAGIGSSLEDRKRAYGAPAFEGQVVVTGPHR